MALGTVEEGGCSATAAAQQVDAARSFCCCCCCQMYCGIPKWICSLTSQLLHAAPPLQIRNVRLPELFVLLLICALCRSLLKDLPAFSLLIVSVILATAYYQQDGIIQQAQEALAIANQLKGELQSVTSAAEAKDGQISSLKEEVQNKDKEVSSLRQSAESSAEDAKEKSIQVDGLNVVVSQLKG